MFSQFLEKGWEKINSNKGRVQHLAGTGKVPWTAYAIKNTTLISEENEEPKYENGVEWLTGFNVCGETKWSTHDKSER